MAVIEELSDATAGLNIDEMISQASAAYAAKTASGSTAPALPPDVADVKTKSTDEFLQEMNKMPLFMTELDEGSEEGGNEALEAIKAMQYEGTPEEIALNFKEQGNERFKTRQLADAREFYTRALKVECADDALNAACLNNRAQVNLELKNYRMAITDCRAALKLNARSDKPWFRAAKALLALDKVADAQACVENAAALQQPAHAQVRELARQIAARQAQLDAAAAARRARDEKARREAVALAAALRARGIAVVRTPQPPDLPDGVGIALADPADPASLLTLPVVFLYQPSMQTDFVTAFAENVTLEMQLREVLAAPPEWDRAREFTEPTVECYVETKTGGLLKAGKRVPLGEILGGGKVEVQDGIVRVMVVPKGEKAKAFIEEWKGRMKPR